MPKEPLDQDQYLKAAYDFLKHHNLQDIPNFKGECHGLSLYRMKCWLDEMEHGEKKPDQFFETYKKVLNHSAFR